MSRKMKMRRVAKVMMMRKEGDQIEEENVHGDEEEDGEEEKGCGSCDGKNSSAFSHKA